MHSLAAPVLSGVEPPFPAAGLRRALSIRQPWAWAILYAGKRVENRRWHTSYRGEVLIHAGLLVDHEAVAYLESIILSVPEPRPTAYCGALIGRAMLVDCVPVEEVPASQREWAVGPWCFVFEDVEPLARPVGLKGALGLFNLDPRTEMRLVAP